MKARFLFLLALCLSACSPTQPEKAADASVTAASFSAVASSVSASTATTTALPAAFLGKWDAPPKPCSTPYRSDMQLDITARELAFFESGGNIKNVKITGPRDVTAEVAMSGEGETWEKSLHMTLSDDGKTLTLDDGKMGTRVRCPA